ncbi:hypothetical protein [Streptomyces sp. UNOC14_S4]|uniref:hypothetical protein n=1 Tax=Streptomyces sp. UNOC14_S4 TaxID=2872340 RepID=UPI001E2DAB9D|nr:hypothetical protein [Streptomyces sp. UNOC14_S4]MCC3766648.1 hypothetical protein [Streptomyces sp. UNOC14_S4]
MGRLWDKFLGSKTPTTGVAPLPTLDVRTALLALNGSGVPFVVREATWKERADLVAECRIRKLGLTLKIRMRFDPANREVRALDEQWEARSLEYSHGQYSRGQMTAVYRQWAYERGPDGRRRKVETFRFDTRDMKDPLRNAVLKAGWTWRGVLKL